MLRREARRFLLVLLVLAGGLCGLTAVLFHFTLEWTYAHLMGAATAIGPWPLQAVAVVLTPTLMAAALSVLVPRLSPLAGGGLSLVRRAYATDPARIDLRAWLGTLIATPLSLGSGAPLGPEGPTVVLTSGVAAGIGRMCGLPTPLVRGMIPVGTAAGIAAIFNTPITGVVFALEEVIGTASRGVLGGAIVAAVAAAVVEKQVLGGRHLLPASPAAWGEARELIGFAVVGLFAGTWAGALPHMVVWLRERVRPRVRRPVLRGALAGLAIGLLGLLSPPILGVGYGAIARWLGGAGGAVECTVAFVAKGLAVCIALAAGLVGGVFAPSLFLGASLGAAVGHVSRLLLPAAGIDPGAYALVGMGAFFAGFLRTPIASVLIVFELTGDYSLVAPLMLAVALSSFIARKISPLTLVEMQLEEQGIASNSEPIEDPLARRRVADVMTVPAVAVGATLTLQEAFAIAQRTEHELYPVVDERGLLVGVLDASALESAGGADGPALDDPVARWLRAAAVVAVPEDALDRISLRLGAARETRCPVVESVAHPRLVGFLAPSDLLRARLLASHEEREDSFEPLG